MAVGVRTRGRSQTKLISVFEAFVGGQDAEGDMTHGRIAFVRSTTVEGHAVDA